MQQIIKSLKIMLTEKVHKKILKNISLSLTHKMVNGSTRIAAISSLGCKVKHNNIIL